ncbi:phenylacetaldoxime dehydratase [Stagonosporopsis vannaccii]|nr:phenylacetaldoxime dehydratase [Stagonosporopsis vannaccii]
MPTDYSPTFPVYCARFPRPTFNLVMTIVGAQYISKDGFNSVEIDKIKSFVTASIPSALPTSREQPQRPKNVETTTLLPSHIGPLTLLSSPGN